MTLCLAWKNNENLSLMSDSRLTGPNGIVTDNANKVFTIIVTVSKNKDVVFESTYGMCFAGSYLNGSNLANTISELTSNIKIYSDEIINFDKISEISFILYEHISKHLVGINRERGVSEVFFTGVCPETGEINLSKFYSQIGQEGILEFKREDIKLENNQLIYLGDASAIEMAEKLKMKIKYPYTEFHLLDEIIKDENISTVGGCIQYGCIVADKFRTYGIVDHELYMPQDETETHKEYFKVIDKFNFRSIPFNWEDSKLSKLKIHLGKVFMAPFIDRKKSVQEESDKQNKLKDEK
ncbi:hypothetical protein [Dyadobacter chenhuakuii]|uniref:20S proteasome alpha/beta subunit n=1 Tax=Dyadobacter chenhuakuii TaxID=2909339 RepID=A0ABY4XIB6_9BACT|nr:hypothetical protein [Dyadobacter chenhuakuii]MCF2496120.1 hypothetical protein [Dyadobacter chenhuakuii]USJ30184.1 hypothetical protein NFI80_20255 [Dyadobacter chenhuakuii]